MAAISKKPTRPYRVLSLDGGGMRGIYSAAYLQLLLTRYAGIREVARIDFGKAFDLICGTSTGAILACAVAADIDLTKVISLYADKGSAIFPEKVPSSTGRILLQLPRRSGLNHRGADALRKALTAELKNTKVIDIWRDRKIALAIPAVEMSRHASWVFKTPHLKNSKHRDDGYTLVDVCMASTAAPVFRSLEYLKNPDTPGGHVFVDGGLWANSPVLVGLIDALEMTKPGERIEIFCLGTCPPPSGDQIPEDGVDWGMKEWRMGADAASVGISAQQFAYDHMARMLAAHTGRDVKIWRFPHGDVPGKMLAHLDLDETSAEAMQALVQHGQTDAYQALSACGNSGSELGKAIDALLREAPVGEEKADV